MVSRDLLSANQLRDKLSEASFQHPLHLIKNGRIQLCALMVILYLLANYFDLFKHPTDSLVSNIRMASFSINLLLIYLGVIFLPEPCKVRPFPMLWRFVQGAAFTYAINLLLWVSFSKENLQFILHTVYDNNLGKPLGEKSYDKDCRVFTPENPNSYFAAIVDSADGFLIVHLIGWIFKIWIYRNSMMAWIMSVVFEILELTMEVWLPNFRECWWDHLIFDIFGCNLIGMLIGQWTVGKFKMRKLNWFMEPTENWGELTWYQKSTALFTSREEYIKKGKWHWLAEPWTFNAIVWFWIMNLYMDISYFYIKAMIHLPPPHWICLARVFILGFFGILVGNDYYDYMVSRKCRLMTVPLFLIHLIMILEGLLFLKNMKSGLFDSPIYYCLKLFWVGLGILIVSIQIWLFYDKAQRQKRDKQNSSEKKSN